MESNLAEGDAAALSAATKVGYFFLLRASEYLVSSAPWSYDAVLHGRDVVGRKEGVEQKGFSQADEVVIYIKRSKTDQLNVGCLRNLFATGEVLCPVEALKELEKCFPERTKGNQLDMPLFRYSEGSPVKREHIQYYLGLAAIAVGIPAEKMGSHSLRIGGATALYHSCGDLQRVRRFGRWESDTFHRYLWESHEHSKDLAKGMATDEGTLTVPR